MTNPRDDLMALADRITGHVEALASIPLSISLVEWGKVSNDMLAAAEALRAAEVSYVTPEMVNAAWNKAKDRRLRGLPTDFRAVLEAALAASRPATQVVDRETVARIIDPHAWKVAEIADTKTDHLEEWRGYANTVREPLLEKADAILSLLCPAEPAEAALGGWTYEIQHGPDGEAAYAWVYDKEHFLVCTAKIHHAKSIVDRMNAATSKSPDTSAAVIQSHALKQALDCLSEIAGAHIPDCPAHYAGEELAWAQRHVGSLRLKAEIARDGIAAAIRQLPTSKD